MSTISGDTKLGEIDHRAAGNFPPLTIRSKSGRDITQRQYAGTASSGRDVTAPSHDRPLAIECRSIDCNDSNSERRGTTMPAPPSSRRLREGDNGAWTPAAVAAAWDREDVARAVAEIEDAATALRWRDKDEAPPASQPCEVERPRRPQVWLGVGSLWASIAAVTIGMVGGLVLLMR